MAKFAVYDSATGEVLRNLDMPEDCIALNLGTGESHRPGPLDPATHYVRGDEKEAVPFPERPGDWAVWDWSARAWTDPRDDDWHAARREEALAALRLERTRRLGLCDYLTQSDYPISAEDLVPWLAYRQALRDLPETTADPATPDWPLPPA